MERVIIFLFFFIIFLISSSKSEENISVSPLINVDEIKPSYEEISPQSNDRKNVSKNNFFKEPKSYKKNEEFSAVKVIGLDKITAKTVELVIKIGDKKEIRSIRNQALKMWKSY